MILNLDIHDRIILPALLPPKGSFITMSVVSDIKHLIRFTGAELEEYGIEEVDGNISWKTNVKIEYEFSDTEIKVILDGVDVLDKKEEITYSMTDLVKRLKSKS